MFESLKKPSWLTLDACMFDRFVKCIYPDADEKVIDQGWEAMQRVEEWEDDEAF